MEQMSTSFQQMRSPCQVNVEQMCFEVKPTPSRGLADVLTYVEQRNRCGADAKQARRADVMQTSKTCQ